MQRQHTHTSPQHRHKGGVVAGVAGALAVETALTIPLFVVSLFTVFFFMITAYRTVTIQLIADEFADQLSIGAVCQSAAATALAARGTALLVPLTKAELDGFQAHPGTSQPIFSVILESTVIIPPFDLPITFRGLAFGVAEESAC